MTDSKPASTPAAPADIAALADRLRTTGRNSPCPCGSGRKYKKCCHDADERSVREGAATAAADARLRREEQLAFAAKPLVHREWAEAEVFDDAIDIETTPTGDTPADAPPPGSSLDPDPNELQDDAEAEKPAPLAPADERALDAAWADFERHKHPDTAQMDAHLARLLALPTDATSWNELFHLFAEHRHSDLPGVLRRVAAGVPPTKAAGLGYFCWAAMEELVPAGRREMVPEILALFGTLDCRSYDADSLQHVTRWALVAGAEAEALALAEQFLPVLRADRGLLPHAVSDTCRDIFKLRTGARLRDTAGQPADTAAIAAELARELGDDIHADFTERAARALAGRTELPAELARREFDLLVANIREGEPGWHAMLRQFEVLMVVAREAWQSEQRPPGIAFHSLWMLSDAMRSERAKATDRSNKARDQALGNMIDGLQPSGLERRIAGAARGIMGTDVPRAHLLLGAHATLLGYARRHALIEANLAERTARQLGQLQAKIGVAQ